MHDSSVALAPLKGSMPFYTDESRARKERCSAILLSWSLQFELIGIDLLIKPRDIGYRVGRYKHGLSLGISQKNSARRERK